MGKFLNSWIQVQIFKFLRTVSSYRIRYAEKNLAGITFRELGVTKNKKHLFNLPKCKVRPTFRQIPSLIYTKEYSVLMSHDINYWIGKTFLHD